MLEYTGMVNKIVNQYAKYKEPQEKEDLRQEGLLALIEAKDKIVNKTYAYRVVKHRILDLLERDSVDNYDGTKTPVTLVSIDQPTVFHSAEIRSINKDRVKSRVEDVLDVLKNFPQKEQTVIQLLYVEGQSVKHISEQLRLSKWRVEYIRNLALKKLKRLLQGDTCKQQD